VIPASQDKPLVEGGGGVEGIAALANNCAKALPQQGYRGWVSSWFRSDQEENRQIARSLGESCKKAVFGKSCGEQEEGNMLNQRKSSGLF
jgi:hypothetical protein